MEFSCARCGDEFVVKRGDTERRTPRYCSIACSTAGGTMHPKYNGGLTLDRGRCLIVCRDGSRVAYYRGVVAAKLGRLLEGHEHVHHIDGNPSNDAPENLAVVTASEHISLHQWQLQAGRA